jgi:hypothetical protein
MPYRVHLRNRAAPQPIEIAGVLIETRIVPELPPLETVETLEDANGVMRRLMAEGTPAGDVYAVGWDTPTVEQLDA